MEKIVVLLQVLNSKLAQSVHVVYFLRARKLWHATALLFEFHHSTLWPLALPIQVQVHKQNSASLTCTHSTSSRNGHFPAYANIKFPTNLGVM